MSILVEMMVTPLRKRPQTTSPKTLFSYSAPKQNKKQSGVIKMESSPPPVYGERFLKLFHNEFNEEELCALLHKHYDKCLRQTTRKSPRTRTARTVTVNVQRHGVLFQQEYSDIRQLIENAIEGNDRPQALGYLRVFEAWLS